LMANHAVRNLVREGKTRQLRNVVSTHQSEGMQTLEMGLNDLMAEELIDYDTALRVSLYPKEVERPSQYAGVRQYLDRDAAKEGPFVSDVPRITSV